MPPLFFSIGTNALLLHSLPSLPSPEHLWTSVKQPIPVIPKTNMFGPTAFPHHLFQCFTTSSSLIGSLINFLLVVLFSPLSHFPHSWAIRNRISSSPLSPRPLPVFGPHDLSPVLLATHPDSLFLCFAIHNAFLRPSLLPGWSTNL